MSTAGGLLRPLFPAILTALAALTIWGCTSGDSNSADRGNGNNSGTTVEASCDAIKEIDSYRYTIALKLQSSAFDEQGQPTPDPLSVFTEALTDLFRDMESPPGEDAILTPAAVCADLVKDLAPTLSGSSGEKEVVNGIQTVHHRLDKAALKGRPALLGRSGEDGLPTEFGVDVWLERDNGRGRPP